MQIKNETQKKKKKTRRISTWILKKLFKKCSAVFFIFCSSSYSRNKTKKFFFQINCSYLSGRTSSNLTLLKGRGAKNQENFVSISNFSFWNAISPSFFDSRCKNVFTLPKFLTWSQFYMLFLLFHPVPFSRLIILQ